MPHFPSKFIRELLFFAFIAVKHFYPEQTTDIAKICKYVTWERYKSQDVNIFVDSTFISCD